MCVHTHREAAVGWNRGELFPNWRAQLLSEPRTQVMKRILLSSSLHPRVDSDRSPRVSRRGGEACLQLFLLFQDGAAPGTLSIEGIFFFLHPSVCVKMKPEH